MRIFASELGDCQSKKKKKKKKGKKNQHKLAPLLGKKEVTIGSHNNATVHKICKKNREQEWIVFKRTDKTWIEREFKCD